MAQWKWASGVALAVVGVLFGANDVARAAESRTISSRWSEAFGGPKLDWGSPRQTPAQISQVYSLAREGTQTFLRAEHDVAGLGKAAPPAVHYGKPFPQRDVRLADHCHLSWRWRVRQHPSVGEDAWSDIGASVYVVTRQPNLVRGGRGFKLAWLSKPGARGTKQHGIAQIELRHDAAGVEWRQERVDLCALYEQQFGKIGDEKLLYVGVMTDADNGKSVARADYTDFDLTP